MTLAVCAVSREVNDKVRVGGIRVDNQKFEDDDFKLTIRWAVARKAVEVEICIDWDDECLKNGIEEGVRRLWLNL